MTIKEIFPNSLACLDGVGMKITPLSGLYKKMNKGLMLGGANLVTAMFGIYSVKYISIPL